MIPKLTDFSADELRFARDLFEVRRNDAFREISDTEIETPSSKYEYYAYEVCSQWLTKLTEALQEVERQERIQSN